ncbi:hypothetical protein, partial [Salmonella sp. s54836]|uniref:hypothetical protein n=1 Tax=Salmonella sp. s54836 TaxID=3159673 RepID=UPI003980525F
MQMPNMNDPMMQNYPAMSGMHLMPNQTDYNSNSQHNNSNMIPPNDHQFSMPNISWGPSNQQPTQDHQLDEDILDLVAYLDMPEREFYPGPISNIPNLDVT